MQRTGAKGAKEWRSFVPSFDLFDEVTSPSHIMVTEIVPNPLTCSDDFCNEFLADMQASKITKPNRLHFEGYINAMAFSKAAASCKLPLKHSCLMNELNSLLINDKISKLTSECILRLFNNGFTVT